MADANQSAAWIGKYVATNRQRVSGIGVLFFHSADLRALSLVTWWCRVRGAPFIWISSNGLLLNGQPKAARAGIRIAYVSYYCS